MKFFHIYKLKDILKLLLFILTLVILLTFSKENLESVFESTTLFLQSVFPSLFPFILFTNVILNTNITDMIDKIIGKPLSFIFCIPKISSIAIITGFLCGFPMGAKSISSLYAENKIDYTTAKKLLSFVNNCNPSFVLSTIGISMFMNLKVGILLLISHYLSSIIIGICYTRLNSSLIIHENVDFLNSNIKKSDKIKTKNDNFFNIIKKGIQNTFISLGGILGFIIIFNLLFRIIRIYLIKFNVSETVIAVISAIFEVTKGCKEISMLDTDITFKIILASFALGFSGLCILAQIYSTISDFKFSFLNIVMPKFVQGIISAIVTYILITFTNIFDISTLSVFNNTNLSYSNYLTKEYLIFLSIMTTIVFFLIISLRLDNHKKSSPKTTLLKKGGKL